MSYIHDFFDVLEVVCSLEGFLSNLSFHFYDRYKRFTKKNQRVHVTKLLGKLDSILVSVISYIINSD